MSRVLRLGLAAVLAASAVGALTGPATAATARSRGHVGVYLKGSSPSPAAASTLTYRGGPVVSNAVVQTVEWGAGTYGPVDQLHDFFASILHSPYLSWLKEYDTPAPPTGTAQHIGYGTALPTVQITPSSSTTTVTDSSIQQALIAGVNAGTLAAPTVDSQGYVNTVYAVAFPQGDVITLPDGSQSGVVFCAYHGSTTGTDATGHHLLYEILPDPTTGGMASGCGTGTTTQYYDSYASHELIEVITDPNVGANVLSWYNDTKGEIGDICNAAQATVGAYTVQKEWSNSQNACIATRPAVLPSAPQGLAAANGGAGSVHLTWSPPADDGFAPVTSYDVYRSTVAGLLGALVSSAPTTPDYTDAPPADGRYYYTVDAVNAAGAGTTSNQTSFVVDTVPPSIALTAPSTLFSLAPAATTKYIGSDTTSGVSSYDVRYRHAKWNGGFSAETLPAAWQAVTATTETLVTAPGNEYCFSARVRDTVDNVSEWSPERCQVTPVDDRAMTRSAGWTAASLSSAYRGTLVRTTTKGATLTLASVHAHRVALVLQTCATCGHVKVFLGSTLLATVDTHSATTKNKVVKILGAFGTRTANLRLVAADAGKKVVVDGVGVSLT